MPAILLERAEDEAAYGGKAVQCAAALRAGLPVPPGFAIAWDRTHQARGPAVGRLLDPLDRLVAVRSSAVGEDSGEASFAGQHATVLGVRDPASLERAIASVVASGDTPAARGYRAKLGLDPTPRVAVVIQRLVCADVAGVLFTRDPRSGEDVRVIEASYGLGEAVVAGLVTPDRFRLRRGGDVLLRELGDKDLEIRWSDRGGTEESEVEPERMDRLCLSDAQLRALDHLATRCEQVFGGSQDLEFAFAGDSLFLLQRRAITTV